jgi:hypothetical protein
MNYKSLAWAGGLLLLGSLIGVALCGYKDGKAAKAATATTPAASAA